MRSMRTPAVTNSRAAWVPARLAEEPGDTALDRHRHIARRGDEACSPARSPSSSRPAEVSSPRARAASACTRAVVRREYRFRIAERADELTVESRVRRLGADADAADRGVAARSTAATDRRMLGRWCRCRCRSRRDPIRTGPAIRARRSRSAPRRGSPAPAPFRHPPATSAVVPLVVVVLDDRPARRALTVEIVGRQPLGRRAPMPLTDGARRRGRRPERIEAAAFDRSRRVRRTALPRDNPNDRADGVRSVESALRPAHDFDPLDVGDRQMREVEAAAERIGLHAVNEHERVVRLAAARKDARQRARVRRWRRPTVQARRAARRPRFRPGVSPGRRG